MSYLTFPVDGRKLCNILSCGISFLWFKRVYEGEQFGAKVLG